MTTISEIRLPTCVEVSETIKIMRDIMVAEDARGVLRAHRADNPARRDLAARSVDTQHAINRALACEDLNFSSIR